MRSRILSANLMPLDLAERVFDFVDGGGVPDPFWGYYEVREPSFTYKFRRAWPHAPCGCVLCEAFELLHSAPFCVDMAAFSGVSSVTPASMWLSHYEQGCECSWHTDKDNGDIAFIWNLSKNWKVEYGGNLIFDEITFVPSFNQFIAFDVSGEGRGHRVSPVTVASPKRLALSGWYRVSS